MPVVDRGIFDSGRATRALRAIVAIPVCNEADRVEACLAALARQTGVAPDAFAVLLFVNNTSDATLDVVAAAEPRLPFRLEVLTDGVARPPNAGWARRTAMEAAADRLEAAGGFPGVILTTDADTVVPHDWIARNLAAIEAGAGAVAGLISLDPSEGEHLPERLKARGRLEGRYEALLIELTSRLSPQAHDPWPRHWTSAGASFAVTVEAYRRVGGMPDMPAGEDRAFAAALVAAGIPIRHDPAIGVVTSGRLVGRAVGGVADTMRMRADQPDAPCDERLESVARVLARHLFAESRLARVPLRPRELPLQIALARPVVALLRLGDWLRRRSGRRADTRRPGSIAPHRPASVVSP